MNQNRFSSGVALLQGIYYLGTGAWPIVSRPSFEKVTGPKVDFWIVKTIGAVITVIGAVLVLVGTRKQVTAKAALLGAVSAAALAGSVLIYSLSGRIRPIYAVEAFSELALIIVWAVSILKGKRFG